MMMSTQNSSVNYTDTLGISQLKASAKQDAKGALEEAARQFESLFMNEMLKSMRKANEAFESDLMGSGNDKEYYEQMFDHQMSVNMSQNGGIGLAQALVRQLGKQMDSKQGADVEKTAINPTGTSTQVRNEKEAAPSKENFSSAKDFINTLMPHAIKAAKLLKLDPRVLVSQAALETGWGKHQIKSSDKEQAFNLFGIKADSRWQGEKVNVKTHEYVHGNYIKKTEPFRRYDSYAESFKDYVNFIQSNPRYRKAIENAESPAAYTKELQRAGYATDPQYANKIMKIMKSPMMSKAINAMSSIPEMASGWGGAWR